ncbi:hypothetical protein BG004_007403 [Podila humilis]|nr:hypothetical protein BG004_007403 [Podila humilis]
MTLQVILTLKDTVASFDEIPGLTCQVGTPSHSISPGASTTDIIKILDSWLRFKGKELDMHKSQEFFTKLRLQCMPAINSIHFDVSGPTSEIGAALDERDHISLLDFNSWKQYAQQNKATTSGYKVNDRDLYLVNDILKGLDVDSHNFVRATSPQDCSPSSLEVPADVSGNTVIPVTKRHESPAECGVILRNRIRYLDAAFLH